MNSTNKEGPKKLIKKEKQGSVHIKLKLLIIGGQDWCIESYRATRAAMSTKEQEAAR